MAAMGRLLLRWALLAVSVYGASLVAGALNVGFRTEVATPSDFGKLMIGVAVLSFLNATLGRILKILTLPLRCLTLGLFSLVVNAVVLYIAARLEMGFRVSEGFPGFVAAFVASILISVINGALGVLLPDGDDD